MSRQGDAILLQPGLLYHRCALAYFSKFCLANTDVHSIGGCYGIVDLGAGECLVGFGAPLFVIMVLSTMVAVVKLLLGG